NYSRYQIRTKSNLSDAKSSDITVIPAENIINCTWENIEKLNQSLGFVMKPNSRTNRTKVMIEIALPPDFETKEHPLPSMFFCFGAHASFTNRGNGTAY